MIIKPLDVSLKNTSDKNIRTSSEPGEKMKLRGSVTVFISIILSVLIAFSGLMVDLSRLQTGKKHAQAAVQLSVQSALTQYHAPLKEHYGLMVTGNSQEELEGLISEVLEKNLAVENRFMPGYIDLYGFEVEKVTVTPLFNLTEDFVLEQQITQFMKYRAPVNTIGNFIEKLRALNTCMAQSGLLNKKMTLEKKLQKIREEQVYLRLLFSERIHGFTAGNKPGTEIKAKMDDSKERIDKIQQLEEQNGQLDTAWKAIPEPIEKISQAQEQINVLNSEIESLESDCASYEREYASIESELDDIDDDIDDYEDKIERLEKAISREEEKKEPNSNSISSMQSEIRQLERRLSSCSNEKASLKSERSDIADSIEEIEDRIASSKSKKYEFEHTIVSEMALLQQQVDQSVDSLEGIRIHTVSVQSNTMSIQNSIEKTIRYHEQALRLADEIIKGCEQIQKITTDINAEIADQSKQSDNAFLTRMKADIQKLVLNADPTILAGLETDIEANLSALCSLKAAVEEVLEQMDENMSNLDAFMMRAKMISQDLIYFSREIFFDRLNEPVQNMIVQAETTAASYLKPEYPIEPAINQKEKNEFYRWCNRVFDEQNETDTSKDKGQQKKLKQNIKRNDEEKSNDEKTFNGSDEDMSDRELQALFKKLPSYRDDQGNYPNIVNSESTPADEGMDALLPGEVQRKDDIEQSYENALNQNGNLAKQIGQVLADAGESLVKSMYINEFIVSVFKNANMDMDSGSLILLNGGPQETFYEKAEVEYILFGAKKEKTNATLAQATIFGIRMGLNLIHVYTNSDKTATAMTAATAIAGWTGFGVPIVKNLILLGWAAGESWLDVRDINEGKDVPVYKTKNNWKTDLKSLFAGIANEIIDDSAEWLKQTKDEWITKGDDALQNAVADIVSSEVHKAFLPLEESISELGEALDTAAQPNLQGVQQPEQITDLEDLKAWVVHTAGRQFEAVKDKSLEWTTVKLEDYKKKVTEKILQFLFESQAYKQFVSQVKDGLDDLINSGSSQIADAMKKLGNKVEDTGTKDQLVGTVVSFDYVDYLRLLLFVVPAKTKLLRTADLMQLNMQKTLDNPDFILSNYNSFMVIEAEISMRYLFIPEYFNYGGNGQIKIRWGYGY